jgi:hypothetical protein
MLENCVSKWWYGEPTETGGTAGNYGVGYVVTGEETEDTFTPTVQINST